MDNYHYDRPPDTPVSSYLEHARLYRSLGLFLVPEARPVRGPDGDLVCDCFRGADCGNPGKHPRQAGWREEWVNVRRWWVGSHSNIAIATGAVSKIVVLDVDPRHGGDRTLAELEGEHGKLPPTWRFLTGGGGSHLLFRHPGVYVKSGSDVLGAGLDLKGDGGKITAPPSLHISGRRYRIDPERHPDSTRLARLPCWVLEMIERNQQRRRIRPEPPVRPSRGLSAYGEAALTNAVDRILSAGQGSQEETLNQEVYGIGRLAGAGAVPAGLALAALKLAARRMPDYDQGRRWGERELETKVARSFAEGVSHPRRTR
jgi:putative DNA primase/helicase